MLHERSLDLYVWYRRASKRKSSSLSLRDEFKPGAVRVYRDVVEMYDVWDYWYDAMSRGRLLVGGFSPR